MGIARERELNADDIKFSYGPSGGGESPQKSTTHHPGRRGGGQVYGGLSA